MKRGIIWIALTCLIATSLVLASCAKSTTTTPTSTTTTTKTTTTTTKTTTAPTTTAPTTTTATGNWWDSLGTPQYGGTMTLRLAQDIGCFDPWASLAGMSVMDGWLEKLFTDNWTVNPSEFNYQIAFRPDNYVAGNLAESWEYTTPSTLTVHLHQNVYWQNIAPVNGRKFTAADVVYHFDRMYGLGGMQKSTKFFNPVFNNLQSVTADGDYTVAIQFAPGTSTELITEMLEAQSGTDVCIEAHEVVEAGKINDWHYAIGTGPFILKDFVDGSSATLVANPNYWGTDERYPQNKLPYIDELKYNIIVSEATAAAAFRTGKISIMDGVSLQAAKDMQKTNPQTVLVTVPKSSALTIDMNNSKAPFTNLEVRKALQMAVNLPEITETIYDNTCPSDPSALTSQYMTGWGYPYSEWTQAEKDEYAFNPTEAKALLAAAGVTTPVHYQILVCQGADIDVMQAVAAYWADIGVILDVKTMDSASWTGQVRGARTYDAFVMSTGGVLGMGFEPVSHYIWYTWWPADYCMVNDPTFNTFSPAITAAKTQAEVKQVIRDMNKYAVSQHYSVCLPQPNNFSLVQPNIKGYNAQDNSMSLSNSVGPMLNGFYCARFWIDQSSVK